MDFRPGPGQVALVEYPGAQEPMTGLVTNGHEQIAIDLGAQVPPPTFEEPIVVSVFAPDALYRLRGTARPARPDGVIVLEPVFDVERIQRRSAARVPIQVGVTLSFLDDPSPMIESIVGRTLDIGLGGLRVLTLRPVPKREPTVMFTLPTGRSIVGAALVLSEDSTEDGYEVRLSFQDLDSDDVVALRELVEAYTA
ncbi:MAG: PilZ domain-containing protein [Acidimicrobiia bacterium]|nr:PilZ domain-containing protein [Acidimicrobiia bacterium]